MTARPAILRSLLCKPMAALSAESLDWLIEFVAAGRAVWIHWRKTCKCEQNIAMHNATGCTSPSTSESVRCSSRENGRAIDHSRREELGVSFVFTAWYIQAIPFMQLLALARSMLHKRM